MTQTPVFLGLTAIGIVHTVVGLLALVLGFLALFRDREIRTSNSIGRCYLVATLITAATSLLIFQHGGFNKAHILAILTLVALAAGLFAATTTLGAWSRRIQAFCFSATFLFHLIPGVTEALTRLPVGGAPLASSAEAPVLKPIFAAMLVAFLVGIFFQIRWLSKAKARMPSP